MADKYNPRYPDVLGMEWDPIYGSFVDLSALTQVGVRLTAETTETCELAAIYLSGYQGVAFDSYVMCEVVEAGREREIGHVGQTIVPVNGGSTTGDTGGFTVAQCLADPGDSPDIELTVTGPPETITMEFATAGLFTGKRILKCELLYAFTGFSQLLDTESGWPAPTMNLRWFYGASAHNLINAPGGYTNLMTPVQAASFGEFNDNPVPSSFRPWTVQDLEDLDTGTQTIQMSPQVDSTITPGTFFVHYAALRVTWCEENRVALGGVGQYDYGNGFNYVDLFDPDGSAGFTKNAGARYSFLFSIPDLGSDYGRVFNDSNKADQVPQVVVGPMPHLDSLNDEQPLPMPSGVTVVRNRDGAPVTVEETSDLFPVILFNLTPAITSDSHSYLTQRLGLASVTHSSSQTLERPPSSTSYAWLTFVARALEVAEEDLVATVQGSTATLTYDDYEAGDTLFEEVGYNPWKRFTLPLSAPITVTGAPGLVTVSFSSNATGEWWEVLGASQGSVVTGSSDETYGGNPAIATVDSVANGDLSVRLHTAAPQVTGMGIGQLSQAVTGAPEYCGQPVRCVPAAIDFVRLSWSEIPVTGVGVTGFSYYEIQRSDDVDTDWLTIGKVESRTETTFDDYEFRIGVATDYRVRVYREDGVAGDWSATVSTTVTPSAANAPPGTMWFTTNHDPTLNVVHVPVYDNTPNVDFEFVEAENRVISQLFGRDYSFVQHPTERRGIRFSRPLLVSQLATPDVGERADRQFNPLRDLAWAPIPYVCVRDDEGNRWWMSMAVPSGTMRRRGQIYIARVDLIEVTAEPEPARICED